MNDLWSRIDDALAECEPISRWYTCKTCATQFEVGGNVAELFCPYCNGNHIMTGLHDEPFLKP